MISNKLLQVCKEQIYKPCSVLDNHLSRLTVANKLKRTTILDQSRANFVYSSLRSCTGWGLHSLYVAI